MGHGRAARDNKVEIDGLSRFFHAIRSRKPIVKTPLLLNLALAKKTAMDGLLFSAVISLTTGIKNE